VIDPRQIDITLRTNAAWDVLWGADDAAGNPVNTSGWTGRMQLRVPGAPPGSPPIVDVVVTPYAGPDDGFPNWMRTTIALAAISTVRPRDYDFDITVVTGPGLDPDVLVYGTATVKQGTTR